MRPAVKVLMNYVRMMPQRNKQLRSHQLKHDAIGSATQLMTVPHLLRFGAMTNHVTLRLGTWAASVGLLQYAAGAAGQGINEVPKAQESDKRGLPMSAGSKNSPLCIVSAQMHSTSSNMKSGTRRQGSRGNRV